MVDDKSARGVTSIHANTQTHTHTRLATVRKYFFFFVNGKYNRSVDDDEETRERATRGFLFFQETFKKKEIYISYGNKKKTKRTRAEVVNFGGGDRTRIFYYTRACSKLGGLHEI